MIIGVLYLFSVFETYGQDAWQLKLWYDSPSEKWVEALPVGNGRMGAMVFGDPQNEVIQLNEDTVWAGQPNQNHNPEAKAYLDEVRELLFKGKSMEAQELVNQHFISQKSHGMPYQTLGNLRLSFYNHQNYSNYYRELDLETAVTTTRYSVDDVDFETQVFASHPDEVIVVKISANQSGALHFSASMDRTEEAEMSLHANEIKLSGRSTDFEGIEGKVEFHAISKIQNKGGELIKKEDALEVKNADEVRIYISVGTNFKNYKDISGNASQAAQTHLDAIASKPIEEIYTDHVKDYQSYFNRVALDLGQTKAMQNPTDVRIQNFKAGNDPALVALYFQFGRYLLISSSRVGTQPANLQGIWNDQLTPPWDSKYTLNINAEMNYWPAEITNLSDLHDPFLQMIEDLSETGKTTAKEMYGAKGWVVHHNTDVWRMSGPVDGSYWGMWPMGGAWLSQHLFEKYEFSGDKDYLKRIYPVLKGATEFYLDFLIEDPSHHWQVVSPSISPEHGPPIHSESSLTYGTTMDNQLLFDLFSKTIKTAKVLKLDEDFIVEVKQKLENIPPMQIGRWGQLQEWIKDWDDPTNDHRHVSHLYGLYPSNQISPYQHPDLFASAKTSLMARGYESTGWSMGWKVNLWARLQDGDHALKLIKNQLSPSNQDGFGEEGGTYPNLFDAHPPFQIDGNFGCTAGISEMLMQSHDGAIHILPALPKEWKQGKVSGLRARGGFEVDIEWKDNMSKRIKIQSESGGVCRIRSHVELKGKNLAKAKGRNPNEFYALPNIKTPLIADEATIDELNLQKIFEYDLNTVEGETYLILSKY